MNYLHNRIVNVWNNLDYEKVHSQLLNCFKPRIININVSIYIYNLRDLLSHNYLFLLIYIYTRFHYILLIISI